MQAIQLASLRSASALRDRPVRAYPFLRSISSIHVIAENNIYVCARVFSSGRTIRVRACFFLRSVSSIFNARDLSLKRFSFSTQTHAVPRNSKKAEKKPSGTWAAAQGIRHVQTCAALIRRPTGREQSRARPGRPWCIVRRAERMNIVM